MSLNSMYAGKHWSVRSAEAQRVHMLIKIELRKIEAKMIDKPVDITITGYFKGRALDSDNIISKLYIDGLKRTVIKDDSPKYINSVKTISRKGRENMVEIEISSIERIEKGQ